ncbi:hypothetical protein [Sphingomonas sp. M1-B02]|uniref:hypothetical protein n=1 Tax=Sphingomonas sp. M1-B02 TaxID=3114300 RepID=UPI00223E915A|nr:hypothetical protein [Sphingomonas sp. S6-11]UZK66504.1 hypothetical protein OKW87_01290 [Sphingomonas sp. S6-11]
MVGGRVGAVAATALSIVLRPVGYIIFGILMVVYRRDARAIGYFAAGGAVIVGIGFLIRWLVR